MMNIETLLQAAKILESQQAIPPKKRSARGDRSTSSSSSTNQLVSPPIISSLLTSTNDLNLNLHHYPQRITSDPNDDDEDDDDDETSQQNSILNSEHSTRTQPTCLRDREIHNRLEKHRRAHLKDCFDSLKAEVPCQRDRKITNLQVLNFAIKYIQTLTKKERAYEREIASLNAQNVELQQRLSSLKTELNSQGHDVESWLNSCTDIDHSISTQTASEAEMYQTFDDYGDDEQHSSNSLAKSTLETTKYLNGHTDLDTNNNHQGIQSILNPSCSIDSKSVVSNSRKSTTRSRPRPAKRKLASIPTTNLLESLASPTIPTNITRSENLLDYSVARHLRLDQPCNLLTTMKDNLSSTATLTPITDIRYDIVDMFTKGTSAHLQQQQQQQQQQHQQVSPLPSIASLMNRHTSPIVSPTKQTIGINTEPLTTSTTNILHQTVATS